MRTLKTILIATYIIIIILLLLCLLKCNGAGERNRPPVKERFKADVVMCIDCTGSMDGILSKIKSNALDFHSDLADKCLDYGKEITGMRIKVIAFRDFCDAQPFEISEFHNMPEQEDAFRSFVSRLKADGGGDGPERGHDALGLAIQSEWNNEPDVHQVIILWTDNASHPLSATSPGPKNLDNMKTLWDEKMSKRGKKMILFAPEDPSWAAITDSWDKVIRHDVDAGGGLTDMDYEDIIKALSESI